MAYVGLECAPNLYYLLSCKVFMLSSCEKDSYFHAFVTSRLCMFMGVHMLAVFVLASFGLWAFVSFKVFVVPRLHGLATFAHLWAFIG